MDSRSWKRFAGRVKGVSWVSSVPSGLSSEQLGDAISRRRFVGLAAGSVSLLVLGSCNADGTGSASPAPTASGATPVNPGLPETGVVRSRYWLPPRLDGPSFDLEMQAGDHEFAPGIASSTKGYNGALLGPTLFMRRGETVSLDVTNELEVVSTTHWHGLHVPSAMDGGPHQPIDAGDTWSASFEVLNRASTYWYHPHLHPLVARGAIFDPESTGYQVYEGLAGMIIVEDEVSDSLPIPKTYGVDDIPVIVQDRRFHDDGSLLHFPDDFDASADAALRKGGRFFINGVEGATLEVGAQVVRLRLLNASNARIYNFGFRDGRAFHQIASDGGFLAAPVATTRLILAPAERAEILIDLGGELGSTLTFSCFNSGNGQNLVPRQLQDEWDSADFDLFHIAVAPASQGAVIDLPPTLTTVDRIPEAEAVNASPRPFELGVNPFHINGSRMDMSVVNHRIRVGDTEIWEISNPNRQAHPFHVHGDSFQILSRDGEPPAAHEMGWKDAVLIRPNEVVRIIKRFRDYANADLPYMYHCHILEHEDLGMMGQFTVAQM